MKASSSVKPEVVQISRREFLALAGLAAAAGLAMGSTMLLNNVAQASQDESGKVRLSDHPTPNPAYAARNTSDKGLVLWTRRQGEETLSYRLNTNGHLVWKLCDSTRSPAEIAAEYHRRTGRPETEAVDLLNQLMKLNIVVAGSYVVTAAGFPIVAHGVWYQPATVDRQGLDQKISE